MTKDTQLASFAASEASPSSTPTPTINTPPSEDSSQQDAIAARPPARRPSPSNLSQTSSAAGRQGRLSPDSGSQVKWAADPEDEEEEDEMAERPPMHRPTDGRSHQPLLKDERGRPSYDAPNGSARPAFAARRSTFRSRSPDLGATSATRRKYTYAAFFLVLSLISFTIQTETAVYIQHELGWNKAYCML
ncbi:MAG: hypothetical protein LQ347_006381 [Umbilicaria vellea]|nr:MAG: hypothetical protein LQ347_006381 [Umbilicaria vellea]